MPTAYVYDPRYLEHAAPYGEHPERPMRLMAITDVLARGGALDRMTLLDPKPVSDADLLLAHSSTYVKQIENISARGGGHLDPDTYLVGCSYDIARLAAGGCVVAVDAVLSGRFDNAYAPDQALAAELAVLALDFARHWLKPDGAFLVKVFQGSEFAELLAEMRRSFRTVVTRKPEASRDRSAELYLLGRMPKR